MISAGCSSGASTELIGPWIGRPDDAAQRQRAGRGVFYLERLQRGMRVPDIASDDLDGVAFKLSDYRGKVVVIDFWGDW